MSRGSEEIIPEFEIAQKLGSNDKKVRDKAVKTLQKWLITGKSTEGFTDVDLLRIWKGLWYCIWFSDKTLIQEELAESIGKLIHCFESRVEEGLLFIKCFFRTITREWIGLDKHRMDKFMMSHRRFLRQCLLFVYNKDWDLDLVRSLSDVFSDFVVNANNTGYVVPIGIQAHFADIFLEELAKVGRDEVSHDVICMFIQPFIRQLAYGRDKSYQQTVEEKIFRHLMRQSDAGIDFDEFCDFKIQNPRGNPKVRNEEMEDDDAGSDEDEMNDTDQPLDPRAGVVDVGLSQLQVDYEDLAASIMKYTTEKNVPLKNKRKLNHLRKQFLDLSSNKFPLSSKKTRFTARSQLRRSEFRQAINNRMKVEEEYLKEANEDRAEGQMKKKGKKRKLEEVKKKEKAYAVMKKLELGPTAEEHSLKVLPENEMKLDPFVVIEKLEGITERPPKKMETKMEECDTNLKLQMKDNPKGPLKKMKKNIEVRLFDIIDHQVQQTTEGSPRLYELKKAKKAKKTRIKPVIEKTNEILTNGVMMNGQEFPVVNGDQIQKPLKTRILQKKEYPIFFEGTSPNSEMKDPTKTNGVTSDLVTMPVKSFNSIESSASKKVPSKLYVSRPIGGKSLLVRLQKLQQQGSQTPKTVAAVKKYLKKRNAWSTPGGKKVNFVLTKNTEQEHSHYRESIRNSPSIPYDSAKKPAQSVLKQTRSPLLTMFQTTPKGQKSFDKRKYKGSRMFRY